MVDGLFGEMGVDDVLYMIDVCGECVKCGRGRGGVEVVVKEEEVLKKGCGWY